MTSPTLAAAREYVARGFSVIPLHGPDEPAGQPVDKRGKRPAIPSWKKYQTTYPTDDELAEWFGDGKHNIGIVTGAISGLTVSDFDTADAIEDARRKGFPRGPLCRTAKGYHAFCQYEAGHRNFQKRADLPGLDLRSEGGYVVAAPSVHATGKPYQWMNDRTLDLPLPPLPEWVLARNESEKTPVSELYEAPVGSRNESLARLSGSWLNDHTGVTLSEMVDMAALWNKGLSSPLPLDEVKRTCQSIFDKHHRESGADHSVELIQASGIKPERITWLWKNWLARGKYHTLAGQPGTGKTTTAVCIGATITRGGILPDGTRAQAGSVVMWSGEDGVSDTLVPRFIAAGADMTKVFFVTGRAGKPFEPSRDMAGLAALLKKIQDLALVIIDPIVSAVNGDSHKNAEVRKSLQPLVDLGSDTGACILGITHFSKAGDSTKDPLGLVSGSIAFGAVARVVLGAAKVKNPEETGYTRIFCRIKSNIGPDEDGIAYDLAMIDLPGHDGFQVSTVQWGVYITGHSRDLLSPATPDNERPTREKDAAEFLRGILSDGSVAQKTIEEQAAQAGISMRTINRAKVAIGVISRKVVTGWVWELQNQDDHSRLPSFSSKNHGNVGNLGNVEPQETTKDAKDAKVAKKTRGDIWQSCPGNVDDLPVFDDVEVTVCSAA